MGGPAVNRPSSLAPACFVNFQCFLKIDDVFGSQEDIDLFPGQYDGYLHGLAIIRGRTSLREFSFQLILRPVRVLVHRGAPGT